ncbi:MAG: UvrD-helicase domain-containing protein, partial [Thermodesulfobacteriota bacterium]|nr:UvrD-helicase domain-containing protein [Thermodesulfobacteriota bacterium]
MEFIADLHIHSYLSRATAKNLNLAYLNLWAQLKGITVLATGDFTHPQWFSELCEKLEPKEDGLFALRPAFAAETAPMVPTTCKGPVRFMLCVEISSIYKKDGKTRKVHNLIFAPTLEVAKKINQRLERIGNIASDGRPILGLDSRTLIEIVLETSEDAFLIPAHIWTPWFSVLGSKSGFDSIEECFEDLTCHIFALETGLSADPAMNWRLSALDRFTLVSNSDAHSPANLGREANLFDTELSYSAMREALKTGDPKRFLGTLEYFAEEGKYHFDGHRKCKQRLSPLETLQNKGLCPVCGRPVTVGVMYRVEELADRKPGVEPKGAHPYTSLLPLTDVLSEVLQVGPKSKKVTTAYRTLVERLGSEFEILRRTPTDVLERYGPPLLSEAIHRMRNNQVTIAPGYDGEFGRVSLFTEDERHRLLGQKRLLGMPAGRTRTCRAKNRQPVLFDQATTAPPKKKPLVAEAEAPFMQQKQREVTVRSVTSEGPLTDLNKVQQEAVKHHGGPLLIVAGPGTGKTRTLTHRIGHLLQEGIAKPEQILALTFTNKAAQEMAARLKTIVEDPKALKEMTIKTFHALCLHVISEQPDPLGLQLPICVLNEGDRREVVKTAIARQGARVSSSQGDPDTILRLIS